MHAYFPKLKYIRAYMEYEERYGTDGNTYLHFGSVQGGVLNPRVRLSSHRKHYFVSVEPGFRSELRIEAFTEMSAGQLMAIITNLADNTGYDTIPIVFGASNLAKLPEEDIAVATSKNYSLS